LWASKWSSAGPQTPINTDHTHDSNKFQLGKNAIYQEIRSSAVNFNKFLEERFVWAGILCLAISLAIKLHNAGQVWLYFLLAGGVYWKRALQTLLITAVLGLAAIAWVMPIAPHWMQELHSNIIPSGELRSRNEPHRTEIPQHNNSQNRAIGRVLVIFSLSFCRKRLHGSESIC
jgi:cell division protein FtsW (lipid II flippase)